MIDGKIVSVKIDSNKNSQTGEIKTPYEKCIGHGADKDDFFCFFSAPRFIHKR